MPAINDQERNIMWESAKGMAGAYLNPINWFKYNPGIYQPLKGRIQLPVAGPFGGFGLKTIGRPMMSRIFGVTESYQTDWSKVLANSYLGYGARTNANVFNVGDFGLYTTERMNAETLGKGASAAVEKVSARIPSARGAVNVDDLVFTPKRTIVPVNVRRIPGKRKIVTSTRVSKLNQDIFNLSDVNVAMAGIGKDVPLSPGDVMKPGRMAAIKSKVQSAQSYFKTPFKSAARSYDQKMTSFKTLIAGLDTKKAGTMAMGALSTSGRIGARVGFSAAVLGLKAFSLWETTKLLGSAFAFGAETLGGATIAATDQALEILQRNKEWEFGGNLSLAYLTRGAATERQRAVQAISKSRINARAGLGNEAGNLHR